MTSALWAMQLISPCRPMHIATALARLGGTCAPRAASLTEAQRVEAVAGGQVLQVGGGLAAREPAGRAGEAGERGCMVGGFSRPARANPGRRGPAIAPAHQLPALACTFTLLRRAGRPTRVLERTKALEATQVAAMAAGVE